MLVKENYVQLTASELSQLWSSYQNDSMTICGIKHFLSNVEDPEIQEQLEYALAISERHVKKIREIFEEESYPVPQGFTEEDVNLNAPRLFSDVLYLHYIQNMSKFSLTAYGVALSTVSRDDIIEVYSTAIEEAVQLHNQTKRLLKDKGLYTRDSILPTPDHIDFVKKQSFLTGWFGNRRPLLGIEISSLWYNSMRNALGQAIIQGFSQVVRDKEVRKYFERGREIAGKHLEIFGSILAEDYLPQGAMNVTSEVTETTIPPFSDKLMMYHITALIASGIGQYGMAISSSPRHDLGLMYTRLAGEIMQYSEDGATIMIKNGWMEQPPEALDRKKISKAKE